MLLWTLFYLLGCVVKDLHVERNVVVADDLFSGDGGGSGSVDGRWGWWYVMIYVVDDGGVRGWWRCGDDGDGSDDDGDNDSEGGGGPKVSGNGASAANLNKGYQDSGKGGTQGGVLAPTTKDIKHAGAYGNSPNSFKFKEKGEAAPKAKHGDDGQKICWLSFFDTW